MPAFDNRSSASLHTQKILVQVLRTSTRTEDKYILHTVPHTVPVPGTSTTPGAGEYAPRPPNGYIAAFATFI